MDIDRDSINYSSNDLLSPEWTNRARRTWPTFSVWPWATRWPLCLLAFYAVIPPLGHTSWEVPLPLVCQYPGQACPEFGGSPECPCGWCTSSSSMARPAIVIGRQLDLISLLEFYWPFHLWKQSLHIITIDFKRLMLVTMSEEAVEDGLRTRNLSVCMIQMNIDC